MIPRYGKYKISLQPYTKFTLKKIWYHIYPYLAILLVLGCYLLVEWLESLRNSTPGA